jgi:hypothetical protein
MTPKKILIIFLCLLAAILIGSHLLISSAPPRKPELFGVTFSKPFAEKFGVDWRENYLAIFEDLGIRDIRIPAYWNDVEPEKGKWNFNDIDWQIEKANEYGAKVILAVGRKLPRWPECHEPEWVESYEIGTRKFTSPDLVEYIRKVVERYKDNPAIWAWQVENEPFLPFGECPLLGGDVLDEEIALVRVLSDKPIIVTDSGEFGRWFSAAKRADIFGSTLYRHVYTKSIGHFTYPLPPSFFRLKQGLVKLFYGDKPMIVVELQAEPWLPKMLYETSPEEQFKHFGPERFKKMLEYIRGSGFDTFYFWGVEWWWWLKTQNKPEMWNLAKEAIRSIDAK